jgi:hypothetical protein
VRNRRPDRFLKSGHIGDDVIRGKHQQQRRRLPECLAEGVHRGRGDRRRRVARGRFEQDVGLQADLEKLLGDQEAMVFVGDGNRLAESRQIPSSRRSVFCSSEKSSTRRRNCFG